MIIQSSRYCAPVMTVEVPGIREDIRFKSWFLGTFGGKAGRKRWQHMWQGVKGVNSLYFEVLLCGLLLWVVFNGARF